MHITALTHINMKLITYHIEVDIFKNFVSPVKNILFCFPSNKYILVSSTNNINLQSFDEFIMSFM